MENPVRNVMLNHYIKILYNGFMIGDLSPIYQFLDYDFSFCDWSSQRIYEHEDKIKPIESLNKAVLSSERPFSLKAVILGVEGVSDRGYLTPFDNIALLLCHVAEDKQYYETLFCLRLNENYEIESIIGINNASHFINGDYVIQ
ncbi:hypothetical protein SDC9_150972 [bioreactor metagenome]|uniref:Uncharacterized protein n=1 Tax=bioreactor metagenome TaxID=1076179 RepID=A0A645EQX9_9ZZZZ